jgi:hypothetical protein
MWKSILDTLWLEEALINVVHFPDYWRVVVTTEDYVVLAQHLAPAIELRVKYSAIIAIFIQKESARIRIRNR